MEKYIVYLTNQKQLNALKNALVEITPLCAFLSIFYLISSIFISYDQIKDLNIYLNIIFIITLIYIQQRIVIHLLDNETISKVQMSLYHLLFFLPLMINLSTFTQNNSIQFYAGFFSLNIILTLFLTPLFVKMNKYNFNQTIVIAPAVQNYFKQFVMYGLVILMTFIFKRWYVHSILLIGYIFLRLCFIIQSLFGVIAIVILTGKFWVEGIHGVGVISIICRPFWFFMFLMNIMLVIKGDQAIFIGTESFLSWFVWIGGSGATLGSTIWLKYFSKSQHLKKIGKEAVISSLFNINESFVFGLPVAKNEKVKKPFIFIPVLSAIAAYMLMTFGYINRPVLIVPWIFCAPIGAFLTSIFDFKAIIFSLGAIIISMIIYIPFLYKYDLELLKKEKV